MVSKPIHYGVLFSITLYAALCSCELQQQQQQHRGWYKAGVVEYAPSNLNGSELPQHLILRNTHRFIHIIDIASKHDVDILVFPEDGLTSMYQVPGETHREDYIPYLIELPIENIVPCDEPETHEVLRLLSCAARKARLYLVINLSEKIPCTDAQPGCPSDKLMLYNTNVVFDRNGKIISRYKKYNLCVEPEFNRTAQAQLSVFETDFGARFGMFICFDLLFQEPSIRLVTDMNVTDIAFPTAWFSELPFLSADALQAAFAYSNNINFLASGLNRPSSKNAGSGIYANRKAVLVTTMPEKSTTQLLIARVPLRDNPFKESFHKGEIITIDAANETEGLNFFYDNNFSKYKTKILENESQQCVELHYENNDFICNIRSTYRVDENDENNNITYRLVAFSGERYYADIKVTIEICAVVACPNKDIASCGQRPAFDSHQPTIIENADISIKSNKTLSTFPVTLDKHMLPINTDNYLFNKSSVKHDNITEENQNMSLKVPRHDLITFGILRN